MGTIPSRSFGTKELARRLFGKRPVWLRGFPSDYLLLKNISYRTYRMPASITAPPMRVSMEPGPVPYLSSVIDELRVGNHSGNRNQARGEMSINRALMSNPPNRTASAIQPRIWRINIFRSHGHKSYMKLRRRRRHGSQLTCPPLEARYPVTSQSRNHRRLTAEERACS